MKKNLVRFAFLILAGSAFAGCTPDAGDRGPERNPPSAPRRWVETEWSRTVVFGGPVQDSAFRMPTAPVAVPGGFVVADLYSGSVGRFALTGERSWTTVVNPKPGAVRNLAVAPDGDLLVLDAPNQSLAVLGQDGVRRGTIPLSAAGEQVQAIVPLEDGIVALLPQTDTPFVVLDRQGRITSRVEVPWNGYRDLDYLAGQFALASNPGSPRWVSAFLSGDGFFIYDGMSHTGSRISYVEHTAFPEIVERRSGASVIKTTKHKPMTSAAAVTLSPTRIYVLFGGDTSRRRRIVDVYSLKDGAYIESYTLPARVSTITWYEGGLLTGAQDPYATIAYLKPVGSPLP